VSFYSSSPISSLFSRPRHTQKRLPSLALDCSSQRAHTEIFLVMGRGVWDHKSRSYLSTPCLDPRGAPFLLSNNFYNPICGHVCPGRPVAPGQCRGVSQTISQIMASRAAAVAAVCSPPKCACMCVSKSFRAVSDKLLKFVRSTKCIAARHFLCGDEKSWL
jgi:hypothetical protein